MIRTLITKWLTNYKRAGLAAYQAEVAKEGVKREERRAEAEGLLRTGQRGCATGAFGAGWGPGSLPVEVQAAVVDYDKAPEIGLSAMQMDYLHDASAVTLTANGRTVEAKVYNAFGPMHTGAAQAVRISKGAADVLGVATGDSMSVIAVDTTLLPIRRNG